MTDKEKIELIIQEKHLNNSEFCNEIGISPGTLSHIRSGRTEPTLNILRSIAYRFSDINPAWLFYDEEPMYKNAISPTPENEDTDTTYINRHATEETEMDDPQLSLFAPLANSTPSSQANHNIGMPSSMAGSAPQGSATSRRVTQSPVAPSPMNVQEIVAETLKQKQKPMRKVVEVRIFFDDGTFETFSSK